MKKSTYIVGTGVVVGALAVTLYFTKKYKTKNHVMRDEETPTRPSSDIDNFEINDCMNSDKNSEHMDNIKSNHEYAAYVMEDAVKNIMDNISMDEIAEDYIDKHLV